jgi:hypothetical protein
MQRTTGWFPSLRALSAIAWRLSLLLAFFVGVCFCVLYDYWWVALGCIAGLYDNFIRHPPSFHRRA